MRKRCSGDYAERLPFTVLLDDVAGGADNVVVVRRRAQPVSEPADTGRTVLVGLITSVAGSEVVACCCRYCCIWKQPRWVYCLVESYIFIKHCALKHGVFLVDVIFKYNFYGGEECIPPD